MQLSLLPNPSRRKGIFSSLREDVRRTDGIYLNKLFFNCVLGLFSLLRNDYWCWNWPRL